LQHGSEFRNVYLPSNRDAPNLKRRSIALKENGGILMAYDVDPERGTYPAVPRNSANAIQTLDQAIAPGDLKIEGSARRKYLSYISLPAYSNNEDEKTLYWNLVQYIWGERRSSQYPCINPKEIFWHTPEAKTLSY
jgi:hypothetical protein